MSTRFLNVKNLNVKIGLLGLLCLLPLGSLRAGTVNFDSIDTSASPYYLDITTTDYLAQRLGGYLRLPVLNQTGIAGSYDFDLPPDDPENQDLVTAVLSVVDRLGLKLKRGHGPVRTLVIDRIEQPSEN